MEPEKHEKSDGESSTSTLANFPTLTSQPRLLTRVTSGFTRGIGTYGAGLKTFSEDPIEKAFLDRAVERLCIAVTGKKVHDSPRSLSWSWYLVYLDGNIARLWDILIVPVVAGISQGAKSSDIESKTAVYAVLTEIAKCLFDDGEVTLPSIVSHLRGSRSDDSRGEALLLDCDGQLAIHLVFQMTGWLTCIWDPSPTVFPLSRLQLNNVRPNRRRAAVLHNPVVRNTSISVGEVVNSFQYLYRTAARFGSLLPTPGFRLNDNTLGSRDIESACLTRAYVSYSSLEDIIGVRLVWTATLGQHLEYDQRQKTLYVFKYPSVCLLLYRDAHRTLLSDLFKKQQEENNTAGWQTGSEEAEFDEYLAEMLLSYRLIFALDKRSRASMQKSLEREKDACDPLLRTLCTAPESDETAKFMYKLLDVDPFESYVLIADFPFLGNKLIQLQKASMGRDPSSIRRLWFDRRNLAAWFALWAVLLITFATLILQIGQLVFQIYSPVS